MPQIIPNGDAVQHMAVLIEAHTLFLNRSMTRGDMWRSFPPSDKIRELRERVGRIETARNYGDPEVVAKTIREDAVDLINYATFLIKQIDEGNREF